MKSFILFLIVTSLLTAGAATAEDIIVPESWAGIWETTTTEINCQTLDVGSVTTTMDTLCAGDILNPEDPEFGLDCSGSVTDVALHLECSATVDILPDCSLSISFVSDGTRSGETSSGVSVNTFTYTGTGCFFEDTCARRESTSVRTGDDPDCGVTPVTETRWGSLKSIYR
jgi:hypothetical protein